MHSKTTHVCNCRTPLQTVSLYFLITSRVLVFNTIKRSRLHIPHLSYLEQKEFPFSSTTIRVGY